MTHYTLPTGFIAACGCTPNSTYYPTAALNQMAYGSSTSYGPACGQCFKLTLVDAFTANPPFYPNTTNSVVVKITDLCPLSKSGWLMRRRPDPMPVADISTLILPGRLRQSRTVSSRLMMPFMASPTLASGMSVTRVSRVRSGKDIPISQPLEVLQIWVTPLVAQITRSLTMICVHPIRTMQGYLQPSTPGLGLIPYSQTYHTFFS